jgi:hypothetical protein
MEFLEYFIYNIAPALAAGTGAVFADTDLLINKYDFIFKRTIHVATSDLILMRLFNPDTSKYLSKGTDDLRHISGTSLNGITAYGFTPYNWHLPYRVKGNTRITASLSDNSGAPNQLYLAYHGDNVLQVAPLDMRGEPVDYTKDRSGKIKVEPVIYESPAITTGAAVGAEAQDTIHIDDTDFVCTKITGVSTGTGFVKILDERRNLAWQNQKTHVQNLFGNGQFPNMLTSPRFIGAKTPLNITFENLVGGANTLRIYLHGYKRGGN